MSPQGPFAAAERIAKLGHCGRALSARTDPSEAVTGTLGLLWRENRRPLGEECPLAVIPTQPEGDLSGGTKP